MNRLLFIIFAMLCIPQMWGQKFLTVPNRQFSKNALTKPICTTSIYDDSTIVTYEFINAQIIEDALFPNAILWKYDGFDNNHISGEASFPIKYNTYTTSEGQNISISIIEAAYVDYNYELAPARQPFADNHTFAEETVSPIQQTSEFYPKNIVEIEDVQTQKNTSIHWIKICPVQYDHSNKIARAYTKIKYKVSYSSSPKTRLLDFEITPMPIPQDTITQEYLIISTSKYSAAVNRLAQWKRNLGFRVTVALNSSWTSTDIKNRVRGIYQRNADYSYALIIGDHNDVPSNISNIRPFNNVASSHLTDLYYGCFGGSEDYLSEIPIGRIPVSTLEEADIVVDKIINYEKTPPVNASFYNSGMVCASFSDSTLNEIEDIPYIQTTEAIRNQLIANGKSVERIYYAVQNVNPKYYYNGNLLPSELTRPTFAWNGNNNNIINSINNGRLFALHYGHGYVNGWDGPYFEKGSFIYLNNTNLLPVVFSLNCSTGKFDEENFAGNFLKKANGGCVGIFATSSQTYSFYDSFTASSIFSNIWPQSNLSSSEYHLGTILNNSLLSMTLNSNASSDMRRYQCEILHCFGDPSMQIYTEQPTEFSNIRVSRNTDEEIKNVSVSLGSGESAYIAFHDMRIGNTMLIKGSSAVYRTSSPKHVNVCVYKHNKVPYLNEGDAFELIQPLNTSISSDIITSCNPNPTNGHITFGYSVSGKTSSVNIVIYDLFGNMKSNILCSPELNSISTDLSHLNNGMYMAILVVDGTNKDSKQIIIQK